ncbi:TPA: hypothetical protein HA243_03945 [Candidatus Micrarchaeota archaeon]|nr:hypothetical protein [Candidatus Micrarchaeota archaeon]
MAKVYIPVALTLYAAAKGTSLLSFLPDWAVPTAIAIVAAAGLAVAAVRMPIRERVFQTLKGVGVEIPGMAE